jgi:single-strand DNA-binding protein
MASVNKVIIVGNLGRDPELRTTQSGQAVCQLNMGTNRKYKNKADEMVEETEWHRVVVWGKQAEHCGQYLKKGAAAYVEGRLKTSSYEKDGITKYSTEIIADTVQFLSPKSGGDMPNNSPVENDEVPF